MINTTPVRRQLVGTALRRYREHLGYGLEEAARVLECHRSKVSRIETGQRGIGTKDLRDLLRIYGVGESEQATLTAIADPRNARQGWWQDYADTVPAGYQDYLLLESAAAEIMVYQPQSVPDLLQTRGYALALAATDPACQNPSQREQAVAVKSARQRVVILEGSTRLSVVIGEAAVRQQVGGPDVMAEQISLLASPGASFPDVTLRVLPFSAGAYGASGCAPHVILRFAEAPSLGVVHLPGLSGGACLVDQADVAGHLRAFTQLQVSALPPDQSVRMLREMAG